MDDFNESLRDVIKAVRAILRVKQNHSILDRVVIVMRRYDQMRNELKRSYPDEVD